MFSSCWCCRYKSAQSRLTADLAVIDARIADYTHRLAKQQQQQHLQLAAPPMQQRGYPPGLGAMLNDALPQCLVLSPLLPEWLGTSDHGRRLHAPDCPVSSLKLS